MESELKPLPNVARKTGATIDQLRYWLRLLEIQVTKEGKTRMISTEAANQLSNMAQMVKEGTSPKDAANHILSTPLPVAGIQEKPELNLITEMTGMKKAMMAMAETMNGMRFDMTRMVEENKALRQETASLRCLLLPPAGSAREVTPWNPETPKDPLEGLPWYQRAMVQIFEPWKMRRFDS